MRLLLVGDFRSPLARGWATNLPPIVTELVAFSTRAAIPLQDERLLEFTFDGSIPAHIRGQLVGRLRSTGLSQPASLGTPRSRGMPTVAAETVGAYIGARRLRELSERYRPELVHALRIPFEGICASLALKGSPALAVSIWGNDLTLHAASSSVIGRLARSTLERTAGLHADCKRDVQLALGWGLGATAPTVVSATNGGLDETVFYPGPPSIKALSAMEIPLDRPVIINPRGLREYVRTDVFLRSVELVRRDMPDVLALAVGIRGHAPSERMIRECRLTDNVRLLSAMPQETLAELFRLASVSVSPSLHDGTPNTLLEAMACEAYPVVSDLASTREWIDHGRNGLLFDPTDPEALAGATVLALSDTEKRREAIAFNRQLIADRATRAVCRPLIERWYQEILGVSGSM